MGVEDEGVARDVAGVEGDGSVERGVGMGHAGSQAGVEVEAEAGGTAGITGDGSLPLAMFAVPISLTMSPSLSPSLLSPSLLSPSMSRPR
jgi:hypothetical protein